MTQQQELKYADYGQRPASGTDPALAGPAQVPSQFLRPPPRTALATAKRLEVERAKNPDIPFKLSHMGNTLYTPAMMEPPIFAATDIIEIIPVKGKASERELSSGGCESRHNAHLLDKVQARSRKFRESEYPERRPTTSQESSRARCPDKLRLDTSHDMPRPSTGASGVRTRSEIATRSTRLTGLPKHIAIMTSPRKEDLKDLERTLAKQTQSEVLASQPQNRPEVIPTGWLCIFWHGTGKNESTYMEFNCVCA